MHTERPREGILIGPWAAIVNAPRAAAITELPAARLVHHPAMLDALRRFFDQHLSEPAKETQDAADQRARLAAAALLVEVARSDDTITQDERSAVLESVRRKFELDPHRAAELFELADAQARDAHDLHQFTSKINAAFDPRQKVRLIEELWRAAYADAKLNEHEEHLIRRVADLLHVPHSSFISAKLRVQDSLKRA